MTDDLEARYHAYLAVLNERRPDDLAHFVHERLTYNDEEITGRGYRDMVADDMAASPR
jgi:predicted ester cyclase